MFERGGPKFDLRSNFKVCRASEAHSPGEFELSQRLVALKPLEGCDHSNMVTRIGQWGERGHKLTTFIASIPFLLESIYIYIMYV